jgi:hypothetical protein
MARDVAVMVGSLRKHVYVGGADKLFDASGRLANGGS